MHVAMRASSFFSRLQLPCRQAQPRRCMSATQSRSWQASRPAARLAGPHVAAVSGLLKVARGSGNTGACVMNDQSGSHVFVFGPPAQRRDARQHHLDLEVGYLVA
eukprot:364447-Chlamydomonas_euryale.AAC.11